MLALASLRLSRERRDAAPGRPHLEGVLELRQNPRLFGIVIIAPILQLTMLGYAATTDVQGRAVRRRRRRSHARAAS